MKGKKIVFERIHCHYFSIVEVIRSDFPIDHSDLRSTTKRSNQYEENDSLINLLLLSIQHSSNGIFRVSENTDFYLSVRYYRVQKYK